MPVYYTFAPGLEITAEITAPDARHAKTAFLDYLARNDIIRYAERGAVRKVLKTNRIDPGEIATSVILDYYDRGGQPVVPVEDLYDEEMAEPGPVEEYSTEDEFAGSTSPIMDLSRQTGGM